MAVYLVKRLLSTPSIEPDGIGAEVGVGGVVGVTGTVGEDNGVLTAIVGIGDGFTFVVIAVR
jgi:hypothetical protein